MKEKSLYDIEFQIKGKDLWIRVNDNEACDEDESIEIASKKLEEQLKEMSKVKYYYNIEVLNVEKI